MTITIQYNAAMTAQLEMYTCTYKMIRNDAYKNRVKKYFDFSNIAQQGFLLPAPRFSVPQNEITPCISFFPSASVLPPATLCSSLVPRSFPFLLRSSILIYFHFCSSAHSCPFAPRHLFKFQLASPCSSLLLPFCNSPRAHSICLQDKCPPLILQSRRTQRAR